MRFLRERTGVLDLLRPVGLRPAVDDAARPEALLEGRVLGVVLVLGLLLGVQVVEVAEELVEAVVGGQVLVEVAEVVLAELRGRVALRLEQLGDRRVLGTEAEVGAGQADLGEPGAQRVLAGDEGGAAGGAALLAVEVGEADALVGEAVDVRRLVAHHAAVVAAEVPEADVVPPQDEDVGLASGHDAPLFSRRRSTDPASARVTRTLQEVISRLQCRSSACTSCRCRRGRGRCGRWCGPLRRGAP